MWVNCHECEKPFNSWPSYGGYDALCPVCMAVALQEAEAEMAEGKRKAAVAKAAKAAAAKAEAEKAKALRIAADPAKALRIATKKAAAEKAAAEKAEAERIIAAAKVATPAAQTAAFDEACEKNLMHPMFTALRAADKAAVAKAAAEKAEAERIAVEKVCKTTPFHWSGKERSKRAKRAKRAKKKRSKQAKKKRERAQILDEIRRTVAEKRQRCIDIAYLLCYIHSKCWHPGYVSRMSLESLREYITFLDHSLVPKVGRGITDLKALNWRVQVSYNTLKIPFDEDVVDNMSFDELKEVAVKLVTPP